MKNNQINLLAASGNISNQQWLHHQVAQARLTTRTEGKDLASTALVAALPMVTLALIEMA